ncbi:hypothetical protein PT286_00190 [Neisseriaceae bacterium ESL0693]|nr:hypothetical protein [Neisseriaceae bacterium ESL0693]
MSFLAEWLFNLLGWLKDWFIDKWRLYKNPFIFLFLTGVVCRFADIPAPIEGSGGILNGIMPPMTKFQTAVFTITYVNVWIHAFWIYLIAYHEKHKND